MSAPVNAGTNGVVRGGATLAGIAPPSFALDFSTWQQGDTLGTYSFTNTAPEGNANLVATSTLLTVGAPATIPASPYSNDPGTVPYLPRLGTIRTRHRPHDTDSGAIKVNKTTPISAQGRRAGDTLTFAFSGGQPATVGLAVTDPFGRVLHETISTGNPISLIASYTGTFKITLNVHEKSV